MPNPPVSRPDTVAPLESGARSSSDHSADRAVGRSAPGQPALLIRLFRIIAIAEAFSWLALLIGMYFKWIAQTTEVGVQMFGPIHGGVFVAYVVITLMVARKQRWPLFWTTALALGASIPPFFTVWFERWALRTGRLDTSADRNNAAR